MSATLKIFFISSLIAFSAHAQGHWFRPNQRVGAKDVSVQKQRLAPTLNGNDVQAVLEEVAGILSTGGGGAITGDVSVAISNHNANTTSHADRPTFAGVTNVITDYNTAIIYPWIAAGKKLFTGTGAHHANAEYLATSNSLPLTATERNYAELVVGASGDVYMSMQKFTRVYAPVVLEAYLEKKTDDGAIALIPQFWFTDDGANVVAGPFSAAAQIISTGINKYRWVLDAPTYSAATADGYYVAACVKVDAMADTPSVSFWSGGIYPSGLEFLTPPDDAVRGLIVTNLTGVMLTDASNATAGALAALGGVPRALVITTNGNLTITPNNYAQVLGYTGASGSTGTFSLPSVSITNVGWYCTFAKLGAGTLIIDAADSDCIADSGAGDTIYNSIAAQTWATITLLLVTENNWVVTAAHGTWVTTD